MTSLQLLLILIISILLSVHVAAAHELKPCEPLLLGSFEALTKYALEQKIINVSNIQTLLNADKPMNPISASGQTAAAAKVRESFAKMIVQIDAKEWPTIQTRLAELASLVQENRKTTDVARQETRRILLPKKIASKQFPNGYGFENQIEWTGSLPPTLTITVRKPIDGIGPDFSIDGIKINQTTTIPTSLWKDATAKLKESKLPELKSAQLLDIVQMNSDLKVIFTKEMLDYSTAGSIFLMKGNSVSFVGQFRDLVQVKQCVLLNSGHIDCLIIRRNQWSFIRFDNQGKLKQEVDLQFGIGEPSTNRRHMAHLPDGTPLIAVADDADNVLIFKPSESPMPVAILSEKSTDLGWIVVSDLEVYLAITGDQDSFLIEPFSRMSARTKLPDSVSGDFTAFKDTKGQVYFANSRFQHIQIFKLYGEVEK